MPVTIFRLNRMASELVVPYSEKHAQAHAAFAARNWPDNQLRGDPSYNRWKFRSSDSGVIEGLLLAIRDKRVVGQIGLTPVTLRCGDSDQPVQWASEFRVDPAFRLQGIGPMLIAKAVSRGLPTITDTPTAQSRPILKELGFRELKGPQGMHLPLAPIGAASRFLSRTILQKDERLIRAVAFLAPLYLAWRTRRLRRSAQNCGVVSCRWHEVSGLIHDAQQKIVSPHIAHDASFLGWRCARLGDGLNGMHGLRTDRGSYILFGRHRSLLYAFDWAASDWGECRALFSAVWAAGRRMGADALSVLVNTHREQEWLRRVGFFAAQSPVEVYCHSGQDLPFQIGRIHFSHLDAHANL